MENTDMISDRATHPLNKTEGILVGDLWELVLIYSHENPALPLVCKSFNAWFTPVLNYVTSQVLRQFNVPSNCGGDNFVCLCRNEVIVIRACDDDDEVYYECTHLFTEDGPEDDIDECYSSVIYDHDYRNRQHEETPEEPPEEPQWDLWADDNIVTFDRYVAGTFVTKTSSHMLRGVIAHIPDDFAVELPGISHASGIFTLQGFVESEPIHIIAFSRGPIMGVPRWMIRLAWKARDQIFRNLLRNYEFLGFDYDVESEVRLALTQ